MGGPGVGMLRHYIHSDRNLLRDSGAGSGGARAPGSRSDKLMYAPGAADRKRMLGFLAQALTSCLSMRPE